MAESDLSSKESSKKGKSSKFVVKTRLGNKKLSAEVNFDGDIPDCGTRDMYDALFKNSTAFSKITKQDDKAIREELKSFWSKDLTLSGKKKRGKKRKSDEQDSDDEDVVICSKNTTATTCNTAKTKSSGIDLDDSQDTEDLLKELDEVLNAGKNDCPDLKNTKPTSYEKKSPIKLNPRNTPKSVEEVLDIEDDDILPIETPKRIIFFNAVFEGTKLPARFYETDKIETLREWIGNKLNISPALLQLFLDTTMLMDSMTLLECGIDTLCEVEVFQVVKSNKELYDEGSSGVYRFKVQTNDRRGRGNTTVYILKTDRLVKIIEKCSEDMNIPANKLRLHYDGEILDLNCKPENYDLEGDDCLDLEILN